MKKVFIGSSSSAGAVEKAENIRTLLEDLNVSVTYWKDTQVFPTSGLLNEDLLEQPKLHHAAIFIFDQDDKIEDGDFVPRDNVIYEAGLFTGALGRERVAICYVDGTHCPSDLQGITHLTYTPNNINLMRKRLSEWLNRYVRDDRLARSNCNVIMEQRDKIHQHYPFESRFHIDDGNYKFVRKIRLMNLTSNLLLTPQLSDAKHLGQSRGPLSETICRVLKETNALFELVLAEPNRANIKDCYTKITNRNTEKLEDVVYSSWETIYQEICSDSIYGQAYRENRFKCFFIKYGLPYALFNVEFDDEHSQYNHVKIDLYSLNIESEDQRRSFVIWKEDDSENYNFFVNNFDRIRSDTKICRPVTPEKIESWLKSR